MALFGSDRRHSDRFAEFVDSDTDRAPHTHRRGRGHDEVVDLVRLARRIRQLPPPATPTPEFRAALRSSLVASARVSALADARAGAADRAATDSPPAGAAPARRRAVRTRAAVLIAVMVGAITASGVSAASTGSVPGDPLYTVKRSAERAQLALAGSDVGRGHLYLEFARSRLQEASRTDVHNLDIVLADMDDETRLGVSLLTTAAVADHDQRALSTLRTFLTRQRRALSAWRDTLPADQRARDADPSLSLLTAALNRVDQLGRALTTRCALTSVDDLGPQPGPQC